MGLVMMLVSCSKSGALEEVEGSKLGLGDLRELQIWWESNAGGSTLFEGADCWNFRRRPLCWKAKVVVPRNYCNTAGGTLGAANSLSALDLEFHYGGYGWTLTKGDGERRTYAHYGKRIHQKKHRDGEETFRLVEIRRPNGNRIHYHYDAGGELCSILATNDKGSVVFGWANIVTTWPSKMTKHVTITT
jgi:hypothetical protein